MRLNQGMKRLAAIAALLVLAGCSPVSMPTAPAAPTYSPVSAADKYTQTWTKEYKVTSCSEWLGEMTDDQRRVAAADILTAARNKISGGSGLPSDGLIADFQRNINIACEGSDEVTILEAAYFVYNYDDTFTP